MAEAQIDAPTVAVHRPEEHCGDCGLWLDARWRACPTCGRRLAKAEKVDSIERTAGIVSIVGGVIVIIGSFLTWDTTNAPGTESDVRAGMSGGRGILPLLIGLVVILVGVLAVIHQRRGGNRGTLIGLGLFTLGYAIFQRRLINTNLGELQFRVPETTTDFGPGLWVLALGSLLLIVAGFLLPRQIERGHPDEV